MSGLGRCPDLRNPDLGGSTILYLYTGDELFVICQIRIVSIRQDILSILDIH